MLVRSNAVFWRAATKLSNLQEQEQQLIAIRRSCKCVTTSNHPRTQIPIRLSSKPPVRKTTYDYFGTEQFVLALVRTRVRLQG